MKCKKYVVRIFALVIVFVLIMLTSSSSDAISISKKTRKKWGKKLGEVTDRVFTQENVDRGVEAFSHYVENRGKGSPQTNVYVNNSEPQQPQLYKTSTTNYPPAELASSFKTFAKNIIAHNTPAFQIELYKNELPKNSGKIYNRVCAKDKTIVAANSSKKDDKYKAFCMMTADPNFIFTGGIRAGADIRTVENFFVAMASDLAQEPGHIHMNVDENFVIDILYEGNKITQLGYYDTSAISCARTGNFVHDSMRKMGFKDMY